MKHFLRGVARLITSFHVLLDPQTEWQAAANDADSIASDWQAVGDDMREILPPTPPFKVKNTDD